MSKLTIFIIFLIIAFAVYEFGITKSDLEATTKKTGEVLNDVTQSTIQKTTEIKEKLEKTPGDIKEIVSDVVANHSEERVIEPVKAIAFGDSLTYGEGVSNKSLVWISRLESNVTNYAISGATTFDVLNQIKNIKDENTAYLWVGANDAAQLISLTEFEANYRHIVETITNNSELIILNIPDATKLEIADEVQEQVSQYLIEQYGFAIDAKPLVRQYVGLYNSIIQKIANEYNLTVIDMFNYLDSLSDDLISSDGFHPNEAGHELIADYVKEQMSK